MVARAPDWLPADVALDQFPLSQHLHLPGSAVLGYAKGSDTHLPLGGLARQSLKTRLEPGRCGAGPVRQVRNRRAADFGIKRLVYANGDLVPGLRFAGDEVLLDEFAGMLYCCLHDVRYLDAGNVAAQAPEGPLVGC